MSRFLTSQAGVGSDHRGFRLMTVRRVSARLMTQHQLFTQCTCPSSIIFVLANVLILKAQISHKQNRSNFLQRCCEGSKENKMVWLFPQYLECSQFVIMALNFSSLTWLKSLAIFSCNHKLFCFINDQPLQISSRWLCLTHILVSCCVVDVSVKIPTTYLLGQQLQNTNF